MIQGIVLGLQARVDVVFRLPGQPDILIECVVDTGFEGALALPSSAIGAMGLPYLTYLSANLADDTNIPVDVHVATVVWHDVETDVAVLAMGKRPLLGTALLKGMRLAVDFADHGQVTVSSLDDSIRMP
jgi:clan AA aspartic protease